MCSIDGLLNTDLRGYLDKYPEIKIALENNQYMIDYMRKNPSTINSFVEQIKQRENTKRLDADLLLLEFCKDNNIAIPSMAPDSCIGHEYKTESIGFKWIALAILVVVLLSVFWLYYSVK